MKYSIYLFLLLLNAAVLNAQTVQWVKKGISPGFDNGNAITCDELGSVYATGQIEYTSVFDNLSVSSYGSHDIVVVKYDNDGAIQWIHSAGGHGGDVGHGIGIDAAHNVYVAGEVEQTANYGGGITVTSAGANDIFLAKYNPSGVIQWVKRWGSTGNDKALSVAVSPAGDCFITGYFSLSVSFGGTQLNSTGSRDVFLAKVNSSGTVQWAKRAGGNGDDKAEGISLDVNGNIYLAGSYTNSASFGGTNISNSGNYSAFVAKYNSNGSIQWVKSAGACCDTTQFRAVTVDDNDNVYAAGNFQSTVNFGNNSFTSSGSKDVILVKYDSNGNLIWARQGGGSDEDIAYGIVADNINNTIYITGNVSAAGHFGSFNYTIAGFKDIFVAAYDQSGNVLWDKINGGGHRDIGSAITVDKLGYIYTTGLFNGTAYFDFYTITGYPDTPWADFYIDKLSIIPAVVPSTGSSNLSITSGACTDLNISFTPGNGVGRIVVAHASSPVNINPLNGSIYNGNPFFGNGTNLGNGNYVVYNGLGNNVTVTGLDPGVEYYFSVIEYNGAGASISYGTGTALTGSTTTPNHVINISGLQNSICAGDSLTLVASGGSSYSWSPSLGLSSDTGDVVIAKPQTTTNYTITASDLSGCIFYNGFTIEVKPVPNVSFPNLNDVCANESLFSLNTGSPAGGFYSGPGVRAGQFDPANVGAGTYTLFYTYTDNNGCSNTNSAAINVKSLPSVTITPVNNFCLNDFPVNLQGNPSGGYFWGTGVSSGKFYPSVGVGSYLISYSYTGANSCSDTTSLTAIVNPLPVINLGPDKIVCVYNSIMIDAGSGFTSYAWSNGSSQSYITLDSAGIGLGVKTVYVYVSNSDGCFNSDTIKITFDLCTGITDPGMTTHENIFPNPFENNFSLNIDEKFSYFIFDACGRLLDNEKNIHGIVTIGDNLSAGIYFLEIDFAKNKKIIPVIKSE